jgi:hypothetical protein
MKDVHTRANGPASNEIPPLGERRVHPRYRPKSFTYVYAGESNAGLVADASESGVRITTAQSLTEGEPVELSLQTDLREDPIDVTARAVWLSDSLETAGLQFVDLTDDARRWIRDWIARDGGDAESAFQKPAPPKPSVPLTEELEKMFPLEASAPKPRASAAAPEPPVRVPTPKPATQFPRPSPEFPTQLHRALYERRGEQPALSGLPARSPAGRIAAIICSVIIVGLAASTIVERFPLWWRSSNEAPSASATNPPALTADPSQTLEPQMGSDGLAPSVNSVQPSEETTDATTPRSSVAPSAVTNAAPPIDAGPIAAGEAAADAPSVPRTSDDNAILITPPTPGSEAALITLPQEAITASGVVAVGVQSSALVSPEADLQHHAERLEFGKIAAPPPAVSLPAAVARENSAEIVRLRAVIDERGEIKSLNAIHGRSDLIPLSESLVRQWSQTPARLNGRPIQSFEDITLSFRGGR